jgi:hypothetical protein
MSKSGEIMTAEQLRNARNWIAECVWGDLEEEDISQLPETQVIAGIQRHYSGGLEQFIRDGE